MPRTDFDGDGRDDLLLLDAGNGVLTNWLGQADGGFVPNPDYGLDPWVPGPLIAIGDFNGDGLSDTLWRGYGSQVYAAHTYGGGAIYLHWSLGFVTTVPLDWQVAGVADFNGDGRDDVLWRDGTGRIRPWQSAGEYEFTTVAKTYLMPNDWSVAGTADFTGDGLADILWRHSSGVVLQWAGQAGGGFAWNANVSYAMPADWSIGAVGDFNGDGHNDILWRHDSGSVIEWLGQADESFVWNEAVSYQMPDDWRIAGSGDYDGDGIGDLLWRHESGTIMDWLGQADGTFVSNQAVATYELSNAWSINHGLSGAGYWDL